MKQKKNKKKKLKLSKSIALPHESMFDVLKPLLESLPRVGGEVYVGVPPHDKPKAICLSCGATDKQIMMRRHKPGCAYKAHYAAVEALRKMIELQELADGKDEGDDFFQKLAKSGDDE